MQIEDVLTSEYGPIMCVTALTTVLSRSTDGLRISLKTKSDWSNKIYVARLKIDRRVNFRTSEIAALLRRAITNILTTQRAL